jgi:hypothetical protein
LESVWTVNYKFRLPFSLHRLAAVTLIRRPFTQIAREEPTYEDYSPCGHHIDQLI